MSYWQMDPGELKERACAALSRLESCTICPRRCGVNRLADERGFCRTGRLARVYSYSPHFGEETPLVGRGGSGTIFFSGCNMACVYCQNWDISQLDHGRDVGANELAGMMIHLKDLGCHNINFVTPTHVVPQILEALVLASGMGLKLPLVYNSGGYDSEETLKLLRGVFDIYMPDAKYGSNEPAIEYSEAPGYFEVMKAAITQMHRQVGDLQVVDGIAQRGLLVRHLVLPGGLAGTDEVVRFLSSLSPNTFLNIMSQYRPEHRSYLYKELSRRISGKEYDDAVFTAVRAGLTRGLATY